MRFEASRIGEHAGAILGLALVLAFVFTGVAAAQGTQTGTLTGGAKSADGAALPGVTVTLKSPALQGERTAVTDTTGGYIFRGLPPGQYTVTFSLSGFATVERSVAVGLATTAEVNPAMTVATVQETVNVTAEAPSIITETQVSANYKAATIDKLGMNRGLANIAELAPGVTDNTPNAGQVTISGAFAYDNVFLLNGVDINDNLFGTPNALVIDDAVDEVQVLTNGVSAEFGRFSGGVVNAVTKRGGNKFTGSFRTDFTNSKWQDESLFEKSQIALGRAKPHADKLSKSYQATLGGPIIKDRLWFFVAGRRATLNETRTFATTGLTYPFSDKTPRWQVNLTATPRTNHTLQGTYINADREQVNNAGLASSIDTRDLVTRQLPNKLLVANYNGVLTSNLFVEAQFSQKKFGFRNSGGTSANVVDSPFLSRGGGGIPSNSHYNAPYFDSTDPEDRNNKQYTAALSYFLSTSGMGRHDVKVGGEHFTSTRTGGNSQTSTGFVFLSDPKTANAIPVLDGSGRLIPVFTPGYSRVNNWLAVRGAKIDLTTMSVYANDRWQLNNRWTFNVGARWERHTANTTQAGIVTPNSSVIVPRLGATLDVKGDGQWILIATYGHYAGKASEIQFGNNTNVGSPNLIQRQYTGPAGEGVDFAPGFDVSNYTQVIGGSFPVNNIFVDQGLATPVTKEWTLQAGTRLGRKGEVKAIYAHRRTTNFLEDFITKDQGSTTVIQDGRNFGTFDNHFITNSNVPQRYYQAIELMSNYRVTDRWYFGGHYTMQIKNNGNFEGEAGNQPGSYSLIGDYPEVYVESRNFPTGRLDDFQRHKVRLYSTYDLKLGRAGTATLSALYRFNSALTYSLSASAVPTSTIQRTRAVGYATPPTSQTVFFGARGSESFNPGHLFDFALNYELPVFKTARPWFKAELRNAFNKQPLIGFNRTITANLTGPVDENGLPTTFTKGAQFGQATSNLHTPIPREFRASVGFRF